MIFPAVSFTFENASLTLFFIAVSFSARCYVYRIKRTGHNPFQGVKWCKRQRRKSLKCARKDIFQSFKRFRPVASENAGKKLNDSLEKCLDSAENICRRLLETFKYGRNESERFREFIREFLDIL